MFFTFYHQDIVIFVKKGLLIMKISVYNFNISSMNLVMKVRPLLPSFSLIIPSCL